MSTTQINMATKKLADQYQNRNKRERRHYMKQFMAPEMEVVKFDIADVITTSGGNGTEMPKDEF